MTEIREDYLPGCGYKIYQDPAEFTFTTDSVFLAHFPHLANKAKVLELGCGTGAISFYLAARGAAEVTGLDVNPRMVELFNKSAEANGIAWRESVATEAEECTYLKKDTAVAAKENAPKVRALEWDIKDIKSFCKTETFDMVVANPPYRNSGRERIVGTSACHEKTAVLEDFFAAAGYALHSRGRFALVQLPERFMESVELAIKYNLQPKKLQWVHASVDKPAWIFLLEMVKNGSYGLEVLPPLIMYNADGTLTEQAKKQM
ncbi:MAG: methyltransferase [Acidaminococcaceae bacterium]|nr:methyltransferase [Acidaminococcaceae bacterium]